MESYVLGVECQKFKPIFFTADSLSCRILKPGCQYNTVESSLKPRGAVGICKYMNNEWRCERVTGVLCSIMCIVSGAGKVDVFILVVCCNV